MANSEMDYIHGYMADQTYDPTSINAQSGIAVNEALGTVIKAVGLGGGQSVSFDLTSNFRGVAFGFYGNMTYIDNFAFSSIICAPDAHKEILTASRITITVSNNILTFTHTGSSGTTTIGILTFTGTATPRN